MAELIAKTDIKREEGYLYFCKGDPLCLYKAKMVHGRRKKAK